MKWMILVTFIRTARQTNGHIHTDTHTDKQTDTYRKTDRQAYRKKGKQANIHIIKRRNAHAHIRRNQTEEQHKPPKLCKPYYQNDVKNKCTTIYQFLCSLSNVINTPAISRWDLI